MENLEQIILIVAVSLLILGLTIAVWLIFSLLKRAQEQLTDARAAHDIVQAEMKDALVNTQEELGKARERVLHVDELRTEHENIKIKLEKAMQSNLQLNRQIAETSPKLDELKRVNLDNVKLNEQFDNSQSKVSSLSVQVGEQSTKLEEMNKIENERAKYFEQLGSSQSKVAELSLIAGEQKAKLDEVQNIGNDNTQLRNQLDNSKKEISRLSAELSALKEAIRAEEEKQVLLVNSEKRLSEQFENLANRIFENKSTQFQSQSRSSLDALITPLKTQLETFKHQVQSSYETEARERHSLKDQLTQLNQLNQQMSEEAVNLTNALKGDTQRQGAWGEIVLERVLTESGLREGHEYKTQVVSVNDSGQQIKPDIVVQLPEGKAVVIDSKMSLTAYERYHNAKDKIEQDGALADHITSMRKHIRSLGAKDYQTIHGIQSLDYVLMFVPVEPAFLVAINKEPELVKLALDNNIMLVSPTNLLVALRTIHNIWRIEHQNRNSQQIAERAGRIYDKLQSFVEDMKKVGDRLDKAQESYGSAITKLSTGRGNLIRQAEQMRQLNVSVKRRIDPELAEAALTGIADEDRVQDSLPEDLLSFGSEESPEQSDIEPSSEVSPELLDIEISSMDKSSDES